MIPPAGAPEISVVIPFFNRGATIGHTLASVTRAARGRSVETILVDDGSAPAAEDQLRSAPVRPDRIIRQDNRGLLFARLTGLAHARGEFTVFLDSDDLVGPDKFSAQLDAMRRQNADISYSDWARADLSDANGLELRDRQLAEETDDPADFLIRVQPPPHAPIFRTEWLRQTLRDPMFPPSARYNPVAEIWFYHVASITPAKVVKVAGFHSIVGEHPGARLTNQWERLGVASLAVQEAFMRHCPRTEATVRTRRLVGEKAFRSWRALPYDFCREFDRRLLAIWRQAPRGRLSELGGRKFQMLARLFGPVSAARAIRRLTGHPYRACRTLEEPEQVGRWLTGLPPAQR